MGANSHDEDGEQRRHPEQEEHDEQHGEDEGHGHAGTRARRAGRGHVEERGRDGSARWRRSRLEHDAERQASHWKAVAPDIVVVGATPDVEHRTFVVGDPPGPERRQGLPRRQREHSRATDVHDMTGARLRSKRTGQAPDRVVPLATGRKRKEEEHADETGLGSRDAGRDTRATDIRRARRRGRSSCACTGRARGTGGGEP